MTALTLADCRPEVLAFALLMEAELRANDHKPGWKSDRPFDLAWRIREEADELRHLIIDTRSWLLTPAELDAPGRGGLKSIRERIASEAADIANMAMMTADVSGVLPTRVPVTPPVIEERSAGPSVRRALKTAIEHIEHMAAWITMQNGGYSFESIGEDMPSLKEALTAPESPAEPGAYDGDIFFGDPADTTRATHRWTAAQGWLPMPDSATETAR